MIIGVPKEIKTDGEPRRPGAGRRRGVRRRGPHGLSRAGGRAGQRFHRRRVPRGRCRNRAHGRGGLVPGRDDHEGEGADRARVAPDAEGAGDLHLLPLRGRGGSDPGRHQLRCGRHRLRDGPAPDRRAAAAHTDVGGGRADGGAGGGQVPGEASSAGSGILLGGVPGVAPGKVVIIGGGVVGINAAKMAAGLGAHVTILDISLDRLRYLDDVLPANVDTVSTPTGTTSSMRSARPTWWSAPCCCPGAKAPHLVKRADLKLMKPGSVIVDVAVDQGGCVETIKPTTHENPTYFVDGILHYAVANMPGGVPRTSTLALTNATLPLWTAAGAGWVAEGLHGGPRAPARPQRGRGEGGLSGGGGGIRASAGQRRVGPVGRHSPTRPVLEILFTRLPHGEDLPVPAPATAGSAGYDVASADDGDAGPRWSGASSRPASRRDSGGLRVPDPAALRAGAETRHHAAQHARPPSTPTIAGELMIALINLGAEPFDGDPGHADRAVGVRPGGAGGVPGGGRAARHGAEATVDSAAPAAR